MDLVKLMIGVCLKEMTTLNLQSPSLLRPRMFRNINLLEPGLSQHKVDRSDIGRISPLKKEKLLIWFAVSLIKLLRLFNMFDILLRVVYVCEH